MIQVVFSRDKFHEHLAMSDWCRECIGPGRWFEDATSVSDQVMWLAEKRHGGFVFSFRNDEDAAMFKLRWV